MTLIAEHRTIGIDHGDGQRRDASKDLNDYDQAKWFSPMPGRPTIGEFAQLSQIPAWRWAAVIECRAKLDLDMAVALALYWDKPIGQFLGLRDNHRGAPMAIVR